MSKNWFATAIEKEVSKCGSQRNLAKLLEVSHTTISRWLSEKREPCFSELNHVADVLGWDFSKAINNDSEVSAQPPKTTTLLSGRQERKSLLTEDEIHKVVLCVGCYFIQYLIDAYFKNESWFKFSRVGFIGGKEIDSKYNIVQTGKTNHYEGIEIIYEDFNGLNFEKIIELFFRIHDPTSYDKQGEDIGKQYGSAIFYSHRYQKEIITKIRDAQENSDQIVTKIKQISNIHKFYETDRKDHQDIIANHFTGRNIPENSTSPNKCVQHSFDNYFRKIGELFPEKCPKVMASDILKKKELWLYRCNIDTIGGNPHASWQPR